MTEKVLLVQFGTCMKREMRFKNWYPQSKEDIKGYLPDVKNRKDALAAVVPHAGWMYSGMTAATVYANVKECDAYIILCPNHTGLGAEIAVYSSGSWETPLGEVEVDEVLAGLLLSNSKNAQADKTAHLMEHSVEVQLPFIKALNPKARILPVCIMTQEYKKCSDLAESIFKAVKNFGKKVLVIASSDMSHYVPARGAKIYDDMAIKQILNLDGKALLSTVAKENISMCGAAPAAIAVIYASLAGAKKAELVKYSNSGEVTGDFNEVVGYAGIIIN